MATLLIKHEVSTVVINACRSAAGINESSNLASLLVQKGVKNAIGMSFNVLSLSADIFMNEFYKIFLGQSTTPIEAVAYARGQLRQHSARKTKFNTKVDLEDHMVPQVHSQESEIPDKCVTQLKWTSEKLSADYDDLSSALVGREGDILRLERLLSSFGSITIHIQGSPGVGKTSLLVDAAAWWQKTGLFQQVVYVQLTDLQFQSCTTDKIMEFIAKQSKLFDDTRSPGALTMALKQRSYLLVLDSVDSIAWSPNMPAFQHERQLCLCLRKLKSYSTVISSRTPDSWLSTAIDSRILLRPVSFPSSISIGTITLQKLKVAPEMLATLDDHSFFEQLIGLSAGNPFAIKLLMHDFANECVKNSRTNLLGHLMGLFRLRPIFLDVEGLALEEGTRAIRDLLVWTYEECYVNMEYRKTSKHVSSSSSCKPALMGSNNEPDGLETLQRFVHDLGLGTDNQRKSVAHSSISKQELRNKGLHPAMAFAGFWHNMPHSLEPFTSAVATLKVARRNLDPVEFQQFRTRLCESTEESAKSSNYIHNMLLSKRPFGLTPEIANRCASAATQLLFEVRQCLSNKLCCYANDNVRERFGEEGHSFTRCYYSLLNQSTSDDFVTKLDRYRPLARVFYPRCGDSARLCLQTRNRRVDFLSGDSRWLTFQQCSKNRA